jgi:hypothetical protein
MIRRMGGLFAGRDPRRPIAGATGGRGARRLVPLAGAVAVLATAACASNPRPPATVAEPVSLAADPTDPIAVELEALRAAVIDYYRTERPEHWDLFVYELQQGAIFLPGVLYEGSPPAIGVWHLVVEDGRMALVRQPPVPPKFPALMFYWGVYVTCEEGVWRVTGEYFLVDEVSLVEPDGPERG